ncbi:MAG: putative peptidic bond hydrolase [Microgenomates group bacterium GW2011_GWA2_46_16]|nr:MAG: putative peptidic bond hydrolase [Microgenomates group bacterium GW2011_GWA2_46_16]
MAIQSLSSIIARAVKVSFDEEIAFVASLVKVKSSNAYTPQDTPLRESVEGEMPTLIFEKLKSIGLSPRYLGASKERPNVVAEWGEKRGRMGLMLNGHMDTIPPEGRDVISPYSGAVRNGKIYGLGSLDMKASLAAYIYGVKALMSAKIKLRGKLTLAFVVDEESGACSPYGTQYLLEQGCVPKACFIGEHGSQYVRTGQRGSYRFKIITRGEAVHTGVSAWERGEAGHNAVVDMAGIIEALQGVEIPFKQSRMFEGRKPVFTFPTKISGGVGLNVVPASCEAYGDVRLLPGNSDSQVKMLMVERLQKLGIPYEIQDLMFVPAVEIDPHDPLVLSLQKVTKAVLGYTPEARVSGPGTDGWMMVKRDIPTIMGFGPDGGGEHGKGEWVDLASLQKITEVYARFIVDYLG